jgi:hypothetical protein
VLREHFNHSRTRGQRLQIFNKHRPLELNGIDIVADQELNFSGGPMLEK